MNTSLKATILAMLLTLMGGVFAEIPKTLSYQGFLTNANGEVAPDGIYNLRFRIYSQPSGGNELWEEFVPASVEEGIFSVFLGKSSPLNISFDRPLWLGIAVESGGELTPRSELTAAAYSLNSASIADSIVTSSNITDGAVVRNINGLNDAVNIVPGNNVTVTPSGNSLIIAAADSSGGGGNSPWTIFGNNIFLITGNVGIGIGSPSERLNIDGNLRLPATAADESAGALISGFTTVLHFFGLKNAFAGRGAGNFTMNDTARQNSVIGGGAFFKNTSGANNTALGATALFDNTSGFQNNAIGQAALLNNATGSANAAMSQNALQMNTSGNHNIAIGIYSLDQNTSGNDNTALGREALGANFTGSANTALGQGADVAGDNLTNATAIGSGAIVDASNKIKLGSNQLTAVETAGTIIADAFVGDGLGITNVFPITWPAAGDDLHYSRGNIGIGTATPGIFPGADKYLTISATEVNNSRVAALDLQGSNANFDEPFSRIDFSSVGPVTTTNIARIGAHNGSNTSNGKLAFYTHDGAALNESLLLDQLGNASIPGEITATTFHGELAWGFGLITSAGQLDIQRGASGQALKVQHIGPLTNSFLPIVDIKISETPVAGVDIFGISATSTFRNNAQFIELHRDQDIEFRVDGNGDVYADGSFNGGGADFAEMIEISSGAASVEPGDVLVIDPNRSRALQRSGKPRSTLVAGIYSSKPGFVGSERDWDDQDAAGPKTLSVGDMADRYNEIPVAVVGIVPCKVSAENGAIRPGDLLVTASFAGHAMRDEDPREGTIVGKALGSLSSGTGIIKVLVTLQ